MIDNRNERQTIYVCFKRYTIFRLIFLLIFSGMDKQYNNNHQHGNIFFPLKNLVSLYTRVNWNIFECLLFLTSMCQLCIKDIANTFDSICIYFLLWTDIKSKYPLKRLDSIWAVLIQMLAMLYYYYYYYYAMLYLMLKPNLKVSQMPSILLHLR